VTARAPILFALAALLVGCGPDYRQVRLCQRILNEVEGADAFVRVGEESLPPATPGVALIVRAVDETAGKTAPRRFVCRFAAGRFEYGQGNLVGVVPVSGEPLSLAGLLYLKNKFGLH
jgi:hypothetical protein